MLCKIINFGMLHIYFSLLTYYGLVMPYNDIELGQYWFRQWLGAIRHQAITWTNDDLT